MNQGPGNGPTTPLLVDIRVAYKMLDALQAVLDTDGWHLALDTKREVKEAIKASGLTRRH